MFSKVKITAIMLFVSYSLFSQTINDNLLIYYPFNNNASDLSGNGLNGVVNATLTVDRFGNSNQAYSFNGIDEYIDFPNNALIKPELPVSFSFWVKFNDLSPQKSVIFTTDFAQNNHSGVWMNLSSGRLVINYGDASGNTTSSNRRSKIGTSTLEVDKWYHIVGVVEGPNDMEIYVDCKNDNGTYQGSGGPLKYTSNVGSIGRKDANTNFSAYYFDGAIDEFRYWDRVLTSNEVELLCKITPDCTTISQPTSGAINVPIDTDLVWNSVDTALGYRLRVGTSPGNNDIVDNLDVGNVTMFSFSSNNLPSDSTIYVLVIPYNSEGEAVGCVEEEFTTEEVVMNQLDCTTISQPTSGAINVPIDTDLVWNSVDTALGYRLRVGTSPGNNDIVDNLDVGNVTMFSFSSNNLPSDSTIYVLVIPYNSEGEAVGCTGEFFFTSTLIEINLNYGFSPNGDGINDSWIIGGIEEYPNNKVNIYNRWGDKIYEAIGYNNTSVVFDGNANRLKNIGAGRLPNGTYFFKININSNGYSKNMEGFLVLKR